MTNIPIIVGAVIHASMHKDRLHKKARFSFKGFLTILLRENIIKEETVDHKLPQNLKRVHFTKVNEPDKIQGPFLTIIKTNACDDSFFFHLYGMMKLTMMCAGWEPTADVSRQLDYNYLMN